MEPTSSEKPKSGSPYNYMPYNIEGIMQTTQKVLKDVKHIAINQQPWRIGVADVLYFKFMANIYIWCPDSSVVRH